MAKQTGNSLVLKNVEMFFARLVKPNAKNDPKNPRWEIQLRTKIPAQKKAWEAEKLRPKAVLPDDGGKPYWTVNIQRKSLKKDGTPNTPVEVVGGDLAELDGNLIGNGSIGNVRVWMYQYGDEGKWAPSLQAVQVTKLLKRKSKPENAFDLEDMEIVEDTEAEDGVDSAELDDADNPYTETPQDPAPGKKPAPNGLKKPGAQAADPDADDDIPY